MPPSAPAQLRITLKYADQKAFVEKFASNVSQGGIFISSRTPKAVGTTVRFELLLGDGKTRALKGEGVVAWVREFDPDHPNRPHGMGLRFSRLDAESRKVIDRILAFKRERGLKEDTTVPQPAGLTEGSGAFKITEGSGVFNVGTAPAAPISTPPVAAATSSTPATGATTGPASASASASPEIAHGSVDVPLPEGLDLDGDALDETLARARAIARRTTGSGDLAELEGLLDPGTPPSGVSAVDASRELAVLLGVPAPAPRRPSTAKPPLAPVSTPPPAETSSTAPDTVPEPIAGTSVSLSAVPVPIESSPPTPVPSAVLEDTTDDDAPAITLEADEPEDTRAEALAPPPTFDVTREIVLEAESPFDAEDLGAAELDAEALGEIARQAPPPEDAEPLPPPPGLPPPHERDDFRRTEDTAPLEVSQILEARNIESAPVVGTAPATPADADAAISAELDDLLDDLSEGGATVVAPAPVALTEAAPDPSESTPKPEKKGFFSKLFKK